MNRAALRAILEAARAIASDPAIVAPLVRSTGLSEAGVRLGLARHLEFDASDAELDHILRTVRPAERVHVILSANVFVAPLRALVLARAATPSVTVRPSRRDPVFAEALVHALSDGALRLADPPIENLDGELHVYGRDETIADVRRRAPRSVVRGHGTGMGIAFVPKGADPEAAAEALALDVIAFDQRGCLSPRVVFAEGDGRVFARALSEALSRHAVNVPRGTLGDDERAELARWSSALEFAGELHRAPDHAVGWAPALLVPPTGRHVHVTPWAPAALTAIARYVVCVGAPTLEAAAVVCPPHARPALLGEMQRPPLDGPVDLRDDGAQKSER